MSDWRDIRGREIAGPAHFVADLLETSIQMSRQKRQEREMRQYRRGMQSPKPPATPAQKGLRRALVGAAVVTLCLWLSRLVLINFAGVSWLPLALWAFATLAGLWALFVGLREARGLVVQSLMAAFWSAWLLVLLAVLLLKFVPADASAAYLVRGVLVTLFASVAIYFWIVSGLGLANARWRVRRQIRRRNAPMRPVRRSRNW